MPIKLKKRARHVYINSKVIRKYFILVHIEKSSKEKCRQQHDTLRRGVMVNDRLSARESGHCESKCRECSRHGSVLINFHLGSGRAKVNFETFT